MKHYFVIVVFLLISFFIQTTYSRDKRKLAFLLGGGEGPKKDIVWEYFEKNTLSISKNFAAKGYEIHLLFGNAEGMEKIKNQSEVEIKKHMQQFSKKNISNTLDKINKMVKEKEVKEGDQIIFFFNTHGEPNKSGEELTHCLMLSITDSKETCISIDTFIPIRNLLEKNGIKLAFVDLSCFSGNTLKLRSHKTCVISAASSFDIVKVRLGGEKLFSYAFADQIKSAPPNTSLEEIFLNSREKEFVRGGFFRKRSDDTGPAIYKGIDKLLSDRIHNMPQISTHTNDLIARYWLKIFKKHDNFPSLHCYEKNWDVLGADEINRLYKHVQDCITEIMKLTSAKNIKNYTIIKNQLMIDVARHHDLENIISLGKVTNSFYIHDQRDLRSWHCAEFLKNKTPHQDRLEFLGIDSSDALKAQKICLAPHNINLAKEYIEVDQRVKKNSKHLKEILDNLAKGEKKKYTDLYRKLMKNETSSNPCSEFKI